ncbi:GL19125 [Drosophila persimilis]|uniref:GL19125 n=2 Tax=Drosophila persimilis TaxID=7234 RepID=B4G6X4_DROPE|nr:GL19125 [Drosophila persimilis]
MVARNTSCVPADPDMPSIVWASPFWSAVRPSGHDFCRYRQGPMAWRTFRSGHCLSSPLAVGISSAGDRRFSTVAPHPIGSSRSYCLECCSHCVIVQGPVIEGKIRHRIKRLASSSRREPSGLGHRQQGL